MTDGLSEMPDFELAVTVPEASGDEGNWEVGGSLTKIVTIFVVTISTPRFSLFPEGSKLHGAVPKIDGWKHIETPPPPVGEGVGLMVVVLIIVVDLGVGVGVTVMGTTLVVVG